MMLRRRRMVEVFALETVEDRAGRRIADVGDRVETEAGPLGVRVVHGPREAWVTTSFAARNLWLRVSGDAVADTARLLEALLARAASPEVRRVVVDLNDRVIELLDAREETTWGQGAHGADAAA